MILFSQKIQKRKQPVRTTISNEIFSEILHHINLSACKIAKQNRENVIIN